MKSIDAEILEVERRIAARKGSLGHAASLARRRALDRMTSPAVLAGAALAGFVAARLLTRRKEKARQAAAHDDMDAGKGFALGTLAMTGVTWFIRSQFGGPVGLAQFALSKLRGGRPQATGVPAEHPRQVPR